MPETHTLVMQVSKTIELLVADFRVEFATFIVNWRLYIKACGEGAKFLSRRHFIAEATSPVRDVNKNEKKANQSSS